MRLTVRKVIKCVTFLGFVLLLNVWVSYNVNLWSFRDSHDRGKVPKSLQEGRISDNGGAWPSPPEGNGRQDIFRLSNEVLRKQRSAKSVAYDDKIFIKPNIGHETYNNNFQVQELNKAKTPVESSASFKQKEEATNLNVRRQLKRTNLDDIFISVKTTAKYHKSRIHLILNTWFLLAKKQTHFFTDAEDYRLKQALGGHLVNTNCSTDHSRQALSCKMAVEIDYYMASRKRWFCHMDDDIYLNVPELVHLLERYDHKSDWYLGKPSLKHPLEIEDRAHPGMKLAFWFATGGAGFCISRSLALKMAPYASGGRFMTTAETIRLPDDCTVGYIIEHLLQKQLTVVSKFHSHLEALRLIKPAYLKDQITMSYFSYPARNKPNMIEVSGFSIKDDPTRFRSIHCLLFPTFQECKQLL